MADKIVGSKPKFKDATGKRKREIRRKLREYQDLHAKHFGRQTIANDLKDACRAKKDPQDVVLIAFALAKIEVQTTTKQGPLSAAERLGQFLWNFQSDAKNSDTPLQWALESGAKDVIKFIVAWYILCGVRSESVDRHKCFATGKRSLAAWLQLVGDGELFGGNETKRETLQEYNFLRNRYTLEGLASWLIEPFIVGHPPLQNFVRGSLSNRELGIHIKNDAPTTEIGEDDDFCVLERGEVEEEEWEMLSCTSSVASF